MRQKLLHEGAEQLEYEIRNIVKKAEQIEKLGQTIYWENIGDPIQKNAKLPEWIKDIITQLVQEDKSYGYCHSKGILETRKFLAARTNKIKGAQVSEDDILFFNGLGDAISKLYQFLHPSSRIIGPSPAYATHSSAEAAHANAEPLTYRLDPDNQWNPDFEDLYNQVKYNPTIVGILIINPDNPTGMVYPRESLEKILALAKEFNLMIISDEIYNRITYHGVKAYSLAEVIGDIPGIALKGISKELPWPGARCGWMEFYNREKDQDFSRLCRTLEDVKMTEVCATTLPQKAIPLIWSDARYQAYREERNLAIGRRGRIIADQLKDIPQIKFNETFGAFYNTIVFKKGSLNPNQYLSSDQEAVNQLLAKWIDPEIPLDKRFAYYLLATTGVCVVPLSSFHSHLLGFRVTLLEEDEKLLTKIFSKIKTAIIDYCKSA
ncbi:MAG: pyridoxal phosphate-dependent aminotransferase [Aurantibacter sp.]